MHIRLLTRQTQFWAGVQNKICGDIDLVPLQTIIPKESPFGVLISLQLPDDRTRRLCGIFQ